MCNNHNTTQQQKTSLPKNYGTFFYLYIFLKLHAAVSSDNNGVLFVGTRGLPSARRSPYPKAHCEEHEHPGTLTSLHDQATIVRLNTRRVHHTFKASQG